MPPLTCWNLSQTAAKHHEKVNQWSVSLLFVVTRLCVYIIQSNLSRRRLIFIVWCAVHHFCAAGTITSQKIKKISSAVAVSFVPNLIYNSWECALLYGYFLRWCDFLLIHFLFFSDPMSFDLLSITITFFRIFVYSTLFPIYIFLLILLLLNFTFFPSIYGTFT